MRALAIAAAVVCCAAQAPVPQYTNHLINEKSPYLQLHAHNPVDWYPWGQDAFDKARQEGKPIFLSIGYSTCHWCHVMEAESFSDPAMAAIMNRDYVSIKVDREERPDVDRVYMAYMVGSSGGGAWPINLFLTPDLKPMLAVSYVPPDDRDGRVGLKSLLAQITRDWNGDRDKLIRVANSGAQVIVKQAAGGGGVERLVNARALDQIFKDFKATYDEAAGGFGRAPKFPRPAALNFLLRYYARTGTKAALDMTLATLDKMAAGGIHDQLDGGFHRYATDRAWRVPHFEKMLYDQAQIATSYAEAFQITRNPRFAGVARDTLDYVLRDMRGPEGGFFSAEDADSADGPGRRPTEGAYYVWTDGALKGVLGSDAPLIEYYYGVTAAGNIPAAQDLRGELAGTNVLSAAHSIAETARAFKKSEAGVQAALDDARARLRTARAARPHPPIDDKVIVVWNGMMISALARSAEVLDAPEYLDAARKAAEFIQARLYNADTNLLKRRYRQGEADIDGMLEDYVFLIQASLDLYEASFDTKWIAWAVRLQEQQDHLFADAKGGGYFSTESDAANILVRMKDDYDGAEPSPNSVAAMNLLRLSQITDRKTWSDEAAATFRWLSADLAQAGTTVPQLAVAFDFSLSKPRHIVVAGDPASPDTKAMLRLVEDRFLPNKILLEADGGPRQAQLAGWLPFVAGMQRKDDRATIYVCEDYACRLPTNDLTTASAQLDAAQAGAAGGRSSR
ncbi:MAG TPA: thioredoxin domain-containing protein [Vicinamibacterales bacterium]|jgi:hypothetical protein|nr:thioredoxin domain-containing protein [Vicinamibacterales bacterium]